MIKEIIRITKEAEERNKAEEAMRIEGLKQKLEESGSMDKIKELLLAVARKGQHQTILYLGVLKNNNIVPGDLNKKDFSKIFEKEGFYCFCHLKDADAIQLSWDVTVLPK